MKIKIAIMTIAVIVAGLVIFFMKFNYCGKYDLPNFLWKFKSATCKCPMDKEKFQGFGGAFCATNSMQPCKKSLECPKDEECISDNGKRWFCTGNLRGCFYDNPQNATTMLCVD